MTDTTNLTPGSDTPEPKRNWHSYLPDLTSPWWKLLFGASLMMNLLVFGLALGQRFDGGRDGFGPGRMQGAGLVQLAPRKFFSDLPYERRRELLGIVRGKMRDLRKGNPNDAVLAAKLAEVLEKDAFVEADAKAAIEGFTTGTDSMAARSSAVAMEFLGKLTPEERKSLALAIRDRIAHEEQRKKK